MKKTELIITQAWRKNARWLKLLKPLSWLYAALSNHQKNAYVTGKKQAYRAPVPVWVVGNITVGGSGKTPFIITLVRYLMTQGVHVGVISRGYGGDERRMPCLVTPDSLPSIVGDEPCLISQCSTNDKGAGIPMAVCAKRSTAIEYLLQAHPEVELIVSDDGLQHYAMHRDVEWIIVDAERGFGSGELLPAGFLREPISRLVGADVIYHYPTSLGRADEDVYMYLEPRALVALLSDNQADAPTVGQQVHAISGIGYPWRFFDSLRRLGFVIEVHPMPDHHVFTLADLEALIDKPIITTAKDAVKLHALHQTYGDASVFRRIWVLPVDAQLSAGAYQLVDARLQASLSRTLNACSD